MADGHLLHLNKGAMKDLLIDTFFKGVHIS